MSGRAAPLAPSTSSSANAIASATARTESAGLQRQVKPMRSWYGPMGSRVTAVFASPPVLDPPDEPQARPVVVDGGHLDVDQADGQRLVPDEAFRDVAAMPGRAPRPGHPQRPGGIYPPAKLADLRGDVARLGEERHDHVRLPVRAGPGQPVRRTGQPPAVRRLVQADPVSRLEAQLGRLWPARVPRGRHRAPGRADELAAPGTSIPQMHLMDTSMTCSPTPRRSAGSPSTILKRRRSSTARRSASARPSSTA